LDSSKNPDGRLIATMAVVGKQPREYQCAVFDFNIHSFLDLVASCCSFGTTWNQFVASKLLVLIQSAVSVGQCLLAILNRSKHALVQIQN